VVIGPASFMRWLAFLYMQRLTLSILLAQLRQPSLSFQSTRWHTDRCGMIPVL
jgi:hypothetical protein